MLATLGPIYGGQRRYRTTWAATVLLVLTAAVLHGCGDDKEPRDPKTLVASLGDSITAGTPLWDPDPAVRVQIGAELDRRSEYGYWAERERRGSSFRNCGVAGERTDQIALRFAGCVRGADKLVVQGGVNDIAQGIAPAGIEANLRRLVRRGRRAGLEVAIVELIPWNGGFPRADAPIRELNRRIARLARDEGATLIRWYRVLEDPAKPGRMRPDWTIDGAHPSVEGYRRLGEALELP